MGITVHHHEQVFKKFFLLIHSSDESWIIVIFCDEKSFCVPKHDGKSYEFCGTQFCCFSIMDTI